MVHHSSLRTVSLPDWYGTAVYGVVVLVGITDFTHARGP